MSFHYVKDVSGRYMWEVWLPHSVLLKEFYRKKNTVLKQNYGGETFIPSIWRIYFLICFFQKVGDHGSSELPNLGISNYCLFSYYHRTWKWKGGSKYRSYIYMLLYCSGTQGRFNVSGTLTRTYKPSSIIALFQRLLLVNLLELPFLVQRRSYWDRVGISATRHSSNLFQREQILNFNPDSKFFFPSSPVDFGFVDR